jgi:co-chaperonin GroES (HSP10)
VRLTSDIVAVEPFAKAERYKGSIVLPSTSAPPPLVWGKVLQIGPGHRGQRSKALWPTTLRTGDIVLYPEQAVQGAYDDMVVDGQRIPFLAFLNERDIALTVRDNEVLPLYRRVAGKLVEEEAEVFTGAIWVPVGISEQRKNPADYCKVRIGAVGFGSRADDGRTIPLTVQVGDIVIIRKWDAWEYEMYDGQAISGLVIIDEDQVLAIDEGVGDVCRP